LSGSAEPPSRRPPLPPLIGSRPSPTRASQFVPPLRRFFRKSSRMTHPDDSRLSSSGPVHFLCAPLNRRYLLNYGFFLGTLFLFTKSALCPKAFMERWRHRRRRPLPSGVLDSSRCMSGCSVTRGRRMVQRDCSWVLYYFLRTCFTRPFLFPDYPLFFFLRFDSAASHQSVRFTAAKVFLPPPPPPFATSSPPALDKNCFRYFPLPLRLDSSLSRLFLPDADRSFYS